MVKKLQKYDLIFAFILYFLIFFGTFSLMAYYKNNLLHITYLFNNRHLSSYLIYNILIAIIALIILGVYLAIRRISLKEIGFTKNNLVKSLKSSLLISLVIVICLLLKCLLTKTWYFKDDFTYLGFMFFYLLFFVSFYEEVIMRGFIGNLLISFLPNILGYIIGAILFAGLHLAMLAGDNESFGEVIIHNIPNLISLAGFHVLFSWLFKKYQNITGPIIIHFIWDFCLLLFVNDYIG